jgi:hypothetical protein
MLVIEDASSGERRKAERRLRIGRSEQNDLLIPQSTVSSFHAHIEWRHNGYYVRDLGSVNGTFVDESNATCWTRLNTGGQLRFGPESRWTVQAASAPAAGPLGTGVSLRCPAGSRRPIQQDRLSFGGGDGIDVPVKGFGEGLAATLFVEDDRFEILAVRSSVVRLDGAFLLPGERAPLPLGTSFEVASSTWTLDADTEGSWQATVQAGVPPRSYGRTRIELVERGDFGDIRIHASGAVHEFNNQELRFSLLWVLAGAVQSGSDAAGWMDDEEVRVAVWGRRAASEQASSTLAKLIHDTRSMITGAGLDALFIEKKRGRTRLRLGPDQVSRS